MEWIWIEKQALWANVEKYWKFPILLEDYLFVCGSSIKMFIWSTKVSAPNEQLVNQFINWFTNRRANIPLFCQNINPCSWEDTRTPWGTSAGRWAASRWWSWWGFLTRSGMTPGWAALLQPTHTPQSSSRTVWDLVWTLLCAEHHEWMSSRENSWILRTLSGLYWQLASWGWFPYSFKQ